MKRIYIAILALIVLSISVAVVICGNLSKAGQLDTQHTEQEDQLSPESTPAKVTPSTTPEVTPKPSQKSAPKLSLSPSPSPSFTSMPSPTPVVMQTTCPTLSEKYATITEIKDSLGNSFKQSEYNKCNPVGGYYAVQKGQTITITVDANNSSANPVMYEFVGNGFPNEWRSDNSITVNVNDDLLKYEQIHLRVFVRNADEQFRAPDYDDMIQVTYIISQ